MKKNLATELTIEVEELEKRENKDGGETTVPLYV